MGANNFEIVLIDVSFCLCNMFKTGIYCANKNIKKEEELGPAVKGLK